MAYENKEGFGALFKNTKKEKDSHPDYQGNVFVGGVLYDLAAWLKPTKDGGKYMSISAKPKQANEQHSTKPSTNVQKDPFDDDIGF